MSVGRSDRLLEQVLDKDNMALAWENVAENRGIPGVDHVSIKKWNRKWEHNLITLAQTVRCGSYKPKPLRIRKIPKRDRRQFRTLRIPTVSDRVIQRAVMQVLQPVYESIFLDNSYGYRPGRSLLNAVQQVIIYRERGFGYVLDADIDDFFDQVDHELLIKFLGDDLPDRSLLMLVETLLKSCAVNKKKSCGIPMGSPLSPLLANVYLHRLDMHARSLRIPIVRYADDFLAFGEKSTSIQKVYERIGKMLDDLKLSYEPTKTRIVSFEKGFRFLGVDFDRDSYSFAWENKNIDISGDQVNWLFNNYMPGYE